MQTVPAPTTMSTRSTVETLLALLDGATFANFIAPWGSPAPCRLPDDRDERAELVKAHVEGAPAEVQYAPRDRMPQTLRVESLALAGFCPAADGRCRWLSIDLDAADGHGAGGLVDPARAAACILERGCAAGLGDGLLLATSRGGRGRHVWLILPEPTPLADGVVALGSLVAQALQIASDDASDFGIRHAFTCANGSIARPGQAGALELFPRGGQAPPMGWALALPCAGAFAERGGGRIIRTPLTSELPVPRADAAAWGRFVADARAELARRWPPAPPAPRQRPTLDTGPKRLNPQTEDFIDGRVAEGRRNLAAFCAAANLLGCGYSDRETENLVLSGAEACGLPAHEARAAVASAIGALKRRGRR